MPSATATETETLLAFLAQQRAGVRYAAYGLTPAQLRATPCVSRLSVGGLIKQVTATEASWLAQLQERPQEADVAAYSNGFSMTDDETLESLLAELDDDAEATEREVRSLENLDVRRQLGSAPWMPRNPDGFSARWVLTHRIEEIARHAGHADIIREQIDGATMYALMAAAEGWPETEWLKPWRPSVPEEAPSSRTDSR